MNEKKLDILFMGTPEFAKASLEALVNSNFNVIACFTNPDKPSGRGMKVKMSPVKEYCIEKNIPVYQPLTLKSEETFELVKKLNPNLICVTAYGKILPKNILQFPEFGSINVHGSILPEYRGAAPIQWSIINGDSKTGITTMYMDEGMDTGDMLLKEEVDILDSDNYLTLHDKLKDIGGKLLVDTLNLLKEDNLNRTSQPDEATYAPMLTKDMAKLDFNKTSKEIYNLVRGLYPYMGTYMYDENNTRYKVLEVSFELTNDTNEIGKIVTLTKNKLGIKCLDGIIYINIIQPESKGKMPIEEFLKGSKLQMGDKFN